MLALRLPHLRHRAQLLTANSAELLVFRLLGRIALGLHLLLQNIIFLVVGVPVVLIFLLDALVIAKGGLGTNWLDLFFHCFEGGIRHHNLLLGRQLCDPDLLDRSESFLESVDLLPLPFLFGVLL